MSSASSAVTYTSVYTDSEPGRVFWGADEELSDGGSPRVIMYGYDGLPMLPVAPPSPDYPIYLEYIPIEDEHILSAEEQPLPPIISPTTKSSGYVAESDPEEDHEEYEEDETEDGPVDFPMDGGDDGDDDDDGDSLGYDADDENEDDEDEEEEEEEHLAPADSAVVIPIDEFTSISLPPEAEVERLLAMPTSSPSPLTLLLPPSAGERLARCAAPATLPSPLLPPFSYPPPPVDRRDGESSTRGRGLDYGFVDTVEAEMRHRGIREVWHGIRDTWIDSAEAVPDMASMTLEKDGRTRISQRVAIDSHRVDLLIGDRMTLQEMIWIMEEEAYAAREAWA
uniref:Uncharacterized protein n=1 Tax=Tanacetum cinerariifolium TaxID=118510 RepID=A0A699I030_TANCI|nr:hypothetical protein [Tanacetum cinerariifolium]